MSKSKILFGGKKGLDSYHLTEKGGVMMYWQYIILTDILFRAS